MSGAENSGVAEQERQMSIRSSHLIIIGQTKGKRKWTREQSALYTSPVQQSERAREF